MKRIMSVLAGASLLALAGSATAESVLSDSQMDGVTAGATAIFSFTTIGVGDFGTTSGASVYADTNAIGLDWAMVQLSAGSVAYSVLGGAGSQTSGLIGSSLP